MGGHSEVDVPSKTKYLDQHFLSSLLCVCGYLLHSEDVQ